MPALSRRPSTSATPQPTRDETLRLVSTGSLAELFGPDTTSAASPAHALQQRLLDAYIEAPVRTPRDGRLPLAARSAIILGVTVALWLGIGSAVALALAFA